MSVLNEHHKKLVNGKGKCSVPMWVGGMPSGFCDEDAFGEPTPCETWRDAHTGEIRRCDGKYSGYVPALACPGHGGPSCPGIETEEGVYSGCSGTGGDCPVCGK